MMRIPNVLDERVPAESRGDNQVVRTWGPLQRDFDGIITTSVPTSASSTFQPQPRSRRTVLCTEGAGARLSVR